MHWIDDQRFASSFDTMIAKQTTSFIDNSIEADILLGGRVLPSTAALGDLMMHGGK